MSSEGIITLQKYLFSYTSLCHSSLLFLLKKWRQFKHKNHDYFFMLLLLIMLITFLLQDNVIFLHLKSLKEELVFNNLSYVLKHKKDIFFLF